MDKFDELAIQGGSRIRNAPMPSRAAFSEDYLDTLRDVYEYYRARGVDPGYQGHFEEIYTSAFVEYMGGSGYADAVCTGTAAVFVALAALRLPPSSQVIVSPVTDPGTISAIILNGLVPVVADSQPDSYNIGLEQFVARVTDKTKAAVIVHTGGKPAPVDQICTIAEERGISIVEDCSQAHGAELNGKKVGTFGRIAAFSTMYRKAHMTGGCGGVVYTRDRSLFELVRAFADRGKPFFDPSFDDKDPGSFLFPALNLNLDELSCALGRRSLLRLDQVRSRRVAFLRMLDAKLARTGTVQLLPICDDDSPFFHPIKVNAGRISCSKTVFAEAIRQKGIDLNPHYRYVVAEWPWVRPYLAGSATTPHASAFRDSSFNLLFNENYIEQEAEDICGAILSAENDHAR